MEPGSALHFFLPATGIRVSSGREGGELEFSIFTPSHNSPPTHPEILKLSMVLSQVNNNLVPDCNMRGSKLKISWGGGGGMSPDPPSRHTRLRVCESAFTRYYHPLFPPNSKSCMKPWVYVKPFGEKYPLSQVFS